MRSVEEIVQLHEDFLKELAAFSNPEGDWAFKKLYLPVDPMSKGRHRASVVNRGGKTFIQTYQSEKDRSYEATVREVFRSAFDNKVISGATVVGAVYLLRRPKKFLRKKDPEGPMVHTATPDTDNLHKALMDSIQHFLSDDKVVFSMPATKYYAPKGETGGIWVIIGNENGLQPAEPDQLD